MLDTSVGAASHPGTQRVLNEDSVLATRSIVMVADGMGGHAGGEVASKLAVERFSLLASSDSLRPEDLGCAVADANADILSEAGVWPAYVGMGTTISGLAQVQVGGSDHWAVFNIGDSRVYRFADDVLTQVTVDHSEVEELRSAGRLTSEQAGVYPRRNVVTRSLGTDPAPQSDMWVFPPTPGERFLICSDGLTLELPDEFIASILVQHANAQEAADVLVSAAVEAGGRDNVTAIVLNLPRHQLSDGIDGDTAPRRQFVEPS